MITPDDIKLLVVSGEGFNVEFKLSVPAKVKELSEEICAFANAAGGVLLIGVNDVNEIKGVVIDNAKRSAIQNSLGEITPALQCSLDLVVVDGKTIGVIEVPTGASKPYVLSGAIFVRIGPNSQKLTTAEQMRDFFQQSERIYFDEVLCKDFNLLAAIDEDLLAEFKVAAKLSTSVSNKQIFRNLKLYSSDHYFKNGAILFFGKAPEKYFENAITRCVAFQGTDKRFISDDQPFGGSLYQQFTQAMKWIRGKLNIAYDIEGRGSEPRKEIWEIPETVFKEAIINSLSHRDYYDKGAVTVIEVFDDRVEISNPGGLVSAIPEAEFGKRSHSRNPLIFGLFAKMHLVEQVGSGIVRMKELMKVAGLKAPVFQKEGFFTITLLRPLNLEKPSQISSLKPSLKTKDKILILIKQNSKITILELSQLLHKSRRAIELQIKSLKESELIKQLDSEIIVLGNKNELMPDTGGLVSDTNQKVSDSIGLVVDTFSEHNSQTSTIMNYLSKNQIITSKDVEDMFDVKEARARRILNELVGKGLIEKHGKARSTIYKKKNN